MGTCARTTLLTAACSPSSSLRHTTTIAKMPYDQFFEMLLREGTHDKIVIVSLDARCAKDSVHHHLSLLG